MRKAGRARATPLVCQPTSGGGAAALKTWTSYITFMMLVEIVVVSLSLAMQCIGQSVPISCMNSTSMFCGDNAHCEQDVCKCDSGYFSPTGDNTDCRIKNASDPRCAKFDPECVYCGPTFEGPCQKCINFIQDEVCKTDCTEFSIHTITSTLLTSTVCNDGSLQAQGLPEWTIIVFAIVGVVIVAIVIGLLIGLSVAFLNRSSHGRFEVEDINQDILTSESPSGTLRTARSNSFSYQKENQDTSEQVDYNPIYNAGDNTEPDEESKFMHKLEYLRTQAEVFLKMLNDMRRRLKELSPESPAAQQYRNVMRDVTRLLYLLNKKPSNIQMPADGMTLLDWSEKILNRYLKSQGMIPKPIKTTNRLSVLGPQDETHF